VQGARGLGRRGRRFVQKKINLGQLRQPFVDADFAHVANQRGTAEHGHRHSGEGRGLQAADAVTDTGDAPSPSRSLEPFDCMIAKDVARRQQRKRDRLFIMRRGLLAGHPDQLLLTHHLSAGEVVHAGHQRNIDFAAFHASDQRRRERAVQLELNPREGLAEYFQNRRQHEGGVEVGRAEHDVALDIGRRELRQQFVVKAQDRACITQNRLALGRQKQPPAFVNEDRLSGQLLEPLQLKGDCGLGAAQPPCGLRDASGLDDRHQRTQHPYIEIDEIH
jgi:hypothetical protein